jgi:hypothetical protein
MKIIYEENEQEQFIDKWKLDPVDFDSFKQSKLSTVFEACQFGDSLFSLPAVALEDKELFKSLFTKDLWDNVISEEDRNSLKQYLPSSESDEKLNSILESLFTSNKRNEFPLGLNPVNKFIDDLFLGQYNAAIVKYKQKITEYREKMHLINLKNYHISMLSKIIQQKRAMNLPVDKDLLLYFQSVKLNHADEDIKEYLESLKMNAENIRNRKIIAKNPANRSNWYKFLEDSDQEIDETPLQENQDDVDFKVKKQDKKRSKPAPKELEKKTETPKKSKRVTGKPPPQPVSSSPQSQSSQQEHNQVHQNQQHHVSKQINSQLQKESNTNQTPIHSQQSANQQNIGHQQQQQQRQQQQKQYKESASLGMEVEGENVETLEDIQAEGIEINTHTM